MSGRTREQTLLSNYGVEIFACAGGEWQAITVERGRCFWVGGYDELKWDHGDGFIGHGFRASLEVRSDFHIEEDGQTAREAVACVLLDYCGRYGANPSPMPEPGPEPEPEPVDWDRLAIAAWRKTLHGWE